MSYIKHWTFGEHGITPENAEEFLKELPQIIEQMEDCDVLIYQAGADPHINDPLGGSLTTEQLKLRDQLVFEVCKSLKIPVAWNLAGGYQTPIEKVLEIHINTARECIQVYEGEENGKGKTRKTA